jgi:hypothetical protein
MPTWGMLSQSSAAGDAAVEDALEHAYGDAV